MNDSHLKKKKGKKSEGQSFLDQPAWQQNKELRLANIPRDFFIFYFWRGGRGVVWMWFLWARLDSVEGNCLQVAFKSSPHNSTILKGKKRPPTESSQPAALCWGGQRPVVIQMRHCPGLRNYSQDIHPKGWSAPRSQPWPCDLQRRHPRQMTALQAGCFLPPYSYSFHVCN